MNEDTEVIADLFRKISFEITGISPDHSLDDREVWLQNHYSIEMGAESESIMICVIERVSTLGDYYRAVKEIKLSDPKLFEKIRNEITRIMEGE